MLKATRTDWVEDWQRLAETDQLWAAASFLVRRRCDPNPWQAETFLATGEQDVEEIRNLMGLTSFAGKTVLEVGCGADRLLGALAAQGARVIGVDTAYRMLAFATKHSASSTKTVVCVQGNGRDPSMLATSCCDVVLSWHVIQHIPDRQVVMGLLAEVYRLLKPGDGLYSHSPAQR